MQLGRVDVCLRHAAVDTGVRRVQASAKRANSEDSIEVLSTTESIIPEDLTAITEEEAEALSLTNGFGNEDCSLMGFLKEQRENAASASEPDEPSSDAEESLGDGMCCDGKREDTNAARSDESHEDPLPEPTSKLLQGS